MTQDYYKVLEVDRSASLEEIKKAYKRLALKHHPDRNPGDEAAVARFKEVSEAYRMLSDPERRAHYDRFGVVGDEDSLFHEVDIATVAEFFENIFGDVFGRRRRRGRDIQHELIVEFIEAALGVTKQVTIARPIECEACGGTGAAPGTSPETCSACNGRGEVRYQQGLFVLTRPCRTCHGRGEIVTSPCGECGGTGKVTKEEELTVRLPPGTDDGSHKVVKGYGELGPEGPGDLVITIRVRPHEVFTRQGHDVICAVTITFPQAALGDEIIVPTIDGDVEMKIRPGTQPGQRYKLRNKGIPRLGGTRGDQIVKVELDVPQTLTPRQETLIKELAEELEVDVIPQRRSFFGRLKNLIGDR